MKIREICAWNREGYSLEATLESEMTGYSERGELEQLAADIEAIRRFVAKFAARHIRHVEELNEIVGYRKYEDVEELK